MTSPPRRWYRLRLRTLFWLTLLLAIGASLYSYWSDYSEQAARRERELLSPLRGAACDVVLRDDAVGTEAPGSERVISGTFFLMNDEWIVVDAQRDATEWIPRAHVLRLRVYE